jgi:hypothetical protein
MIQHGLYPAWDFLYFHGNGIPYIIYPFYRLLIMLGYGEVYSVTMVSSIVSSLFLYIPIYVFLRTYLSKILSAYALLSFYFIGEAIFTFNFYNSLYFTGAPMGLRFFPHLIPLLFAARLEERNIRVLVWALGCVMPMSLWLGAEQGIYASLSAAFIILVRCKTYQNAIRNLTFYAVVWLAVFLGHQYVFFGRLQLAEQLSVISSNQVWVYGVFPNSYYTSFSDVFSWSYTGELPSLIMTYLGTLVFITSLWFGISKNDNCLKYLGSLYVGGLLSWVSSIGYIGQHQSSLMSKYVLLTLIYMFFIMIKKKAKI